MEIKKVLVAGASGYLARFVIEHLRNEFELTLFDQVKPAEAVGDVPFVLGDIAVYEDVEAACAGQDAVVHLVALVRGREDKPTSLFADVMVKGTWHIAEACIRHEVRRLVNVSSIIVNGFQVAPGRAIRVEDPPQFAKNDLFYCLAKKLGEQVGDAYHQAHGLSVIHLRPGVIADDGVNPPSPRLPAEPVSYWCNYVDPRDVAQAVERALRTDLAHGTFNIVAGRSDSLFDWMTARDQLGYHPQHNWPEIPLQGVPR